MKRALLAGVMTLALCGVGVAADDDDWFIIDLEKKVCVQMDQTPDEFVKLQIMSGFKATPSAKNSERAILYIFSKDGKDDFVSMLKGRDFCERMLTLTNSEAAPKAAPAPPPVIVDPPVPTAAPPKASAPPAYESVVDVANWDVPVVAPKIVKRPTRRYTYHYRHYRYHEAPVQFTPSPFTPTTIPPPSANVGMVPPPPVEGSLIRQEPLPPLK